MVQFTEMVVRKTSPALYRLLGIFLPLITTNCAVLGVALLNINLGHNFLQSALYGFAAAVGFSLVMVLFAAIRERRWLQMCLRRFVVMPLPGNCRFNVAGLYGL